MYKFRKSEVGKVKEIAKSLISEVKGEIDPHLTFLAAFEKYLRYKNEKEFTIILNEDEIILQDDE